MKLYGNTISDKEIVERMLISLFAKFDPIVTTIEQSKDINTMFMTELVGALKVHKQIINRRTKSSTKGAFQSKHKEKMS